MLAVLDDPGVVDNPRDHTDLGRDPLGTRAHQQLGIPRRIGQELLHRLVPRRRLLQPKQRRLQALTASVLDQPTHIEQRVLALTRKREPARHLPDEPLHPLTHPHRWRIQYRHSLHTLLLRTMPDATDTVRHERRGPFNPLTKSY